MTIQAVERRAEADADLWLMTYRQRMQTAFQADQVTVTGTGYFGASRREVRQLAWRLGAAYCGDLTHGVTTHLVCKDAAQPITEKVKMAEAWGIPVVDHSWLLDSVATQTVLLTEKYALVPPSILAKGVPPATVTARTSKHVTAKRMLDKQLASSNISQSHAADNEEVELLRAADSPTNCQLADLLLSTTLSPASGSSADAFISHMKHMHHKYSITQQFILQVPRYLSRAIPKSKSTLKICPLACHPLPQPHPLCPPPTSAPAQLALLLHRRHQLCQTCTGEQLFTVHLTSLPAAKHSQT